ncbi:S-adenosyl-L-methionine-dependent methyltransferase [Auricularia subglabra TFB-10046 SS5]|nr:S-adenosyl-L-methionine-dependent methyltransferase [Auricularia subglabra TFB-10046 SS5]
MDVVDQMHALSLADRGHYPGQSSGSSEGSYSDVDAMSVGAPSEKMDMDSTRGCSPAPSIYSFHSSVDGCALREVHGRYFNSQNETYMLPADEPERGRLGLQHDALLLSLGSLYQNPEAVHDVLAPRPGYTPSIIDIGTGTGTWAIAMAKQFPHCEVVGIDLAPPKPQEAIPQNCRFEIDDANLGFPHFRERFDVVHTRSISAGIIDYPFFLRECARMLRPGGVFLFADGDLQLYNERFEALAACEEGEEDYSWLQRIFFATYNSMKNRGAHIDGMTLAPKWIKEIPDFEDVCTQDIYIPVGSWLKGDSRVEVVSDLIRKDACLVIAGMKPMLMSEGYFEDTVDVFIDEALHEMESLSVHTYSLWHYSWARKTLLPTMPDEETLTAIAKQKQQQPQLSTQQVMSPTNAPPGSAPIYPPAPPQLPPQMVDNTPSVQREPAPGGCKPVVPHARSRYDNYVPHTQPADPYAPFDYAAYHANPDPARYGVAPLQPVVLPRVEGEGAGHSLAALAQLQPEVFGQYWAQHQEQMRQREAQEEMQRQRQQQMWQQQQQQQQQQNWYPQHAQFQQQQQQQPAASYDEELARYMQQQLYLQERHQPGFGEAGPSNY